VRRSVMVLPFTDGGWIDDTDGPALGVEQPAMNRTRYEDAMKVRIVGPEGTSSLRAGRGVAVPGLPGVLATHTASAGEEAGLLLDTPAAGREGEVADHLFVRGLKVPQGLH
jgi:hypothetical protein